MSADQYFTLGGESFGEVREKASKFLAHAFPIADEEAFRARLAAVAKEHHGARHICYGWVLGPAGEKFRAFDAGEPAGSAGKPILRQLQGAGLTCAAIIVVRYFGGTLLGKAGLAHAFADAAKSALACNTVVQCTVMAAVEVQCGYAAVEEVKRQVKAMEGALVKATYAGRCVLHVHIPRSRATEQIAKWTAQGITARVLAGA